MGPAHLAQCIDFHFDIDRPLGIIGDPGLGKSQLVAQAAERYGLPLMTMNLVLSDSTDFKGCPFTTTLPDGTRVLEWVKQREFLTGKPFVLFLDELFQASTAVMNVAAPIILEKRIDDIHLHPESRVIFASNKASNKAGTNRVPSHIPNRATIVELEVSVEDWLVYAIEHDAPESVPGFIIMRPELLHKFDPNHMVNPTPRQWMGVADMIRKGLPSEIRLEAIGGCIGAGPAAEFVGFEKVMGQIPTREQIMLNPKTAPVPEEPSARYAVTGMLMQNTTANNIDTVLTYMGRMPEDFQVVLMRNVLRLQPAVTSTRAYCEWAVRFSKYLR